MFRCHLWFPNIFEFKGGIQVYSAFLLDALQSIAPETHYEVFLKHDKRYPPELERRENLRFHCTGKWSLSIRTLMFASQVLYYGAVEKPDLILTTHLNFTPAAYWLKRQFGIPYWTIVYGVDAWNIQRRRLKVALQNADRIISIGEYTRDRLLKEQNLDPQRFSLLPCTFDASSFQIAPKSQTLLDRYGLKPDTKIILTVARLDDSEQYKGYDKIISALPLIRQQIPNIHYILVGKGSDRDRVEGLIEGLQLQDFVTLAGFVPDEEILDYYNLCDVFAMPSKGEGFGIVYLEALACGKPALGGNCDGAIDALRGGELGALVNPDSVEEIAATLVNILQGTYPNPLMYQPEHLREKVIEVYGVEQFNRTLAQILATKIS
ncbi:glycosyltransferase [Oscillatoria sp. FACHB-1406]|uniref:glycosyltransferase n=1 Tax=Oscillatoria sp. FACHB-1406 TaxID=2692846 RepID=UPI00168A18B6|nr:glycosyltransferase [Oscillatoria sp. FACHB-1406]MBD2576106.1 glycosyltransferase [Oscillatoria sp. FACHB-1406]